MHNLLRRAAVAALLLLPSSATAPIFASPKPPTVDPTYGLTTAAPASTSKPLPANWIWTGRTADNQTVYLRRTFTLSTMPKSALLYVTADNGFVAYINGHQVGQSAADAANNGWQHVQHLDIAHDLAPGRNVIAVQATNVQGAAGCVAALRLPGTQNIATDGDWKALDGMAPDGWNAAAFDDGLWPYAKVIGPVSSDPWASAAGGLSGWPGLGSVTAPYLRHLMIPVAHVLDVHAGKGKITGVAGLVQSPTAMLTVTPPPLGTTTPTDLVLDFGEELPGRVWITSTTGGTVQVGPGESEDEAVLQPWIKLQTFQLDPQNGIGTEYSAFRYVHLVFPPAQGKPRQISLRVSVDHLYYPVQYKGSFDCSDPLLTKIWYTGAYTAHSCMQQDIWDAPKRDRARWSGDLQVSGETINNVFADRFLMERTLSNLRKDAQGGRPDSDPPTNDVNGIPGYSIAWICTLADFCRHSGDMDYIKSQHDALISMLEYLRGDAGDTPIFANTRKEWLFVDWANDFAPDSGPNTDYARVNETTHLYLIQGLRQAAYLLNEMGDDANAHKYTAWADDLTQRARQVIAPTAASTYSDRIQENAMAVYSGAATPSQQNAVWNAVLKPGTKPWDRPATPYYDNFVIYAMSMSGHTEEAMKFIRQFWGGMIAEGATTFWEGYDPRWPKEHFHEHLQADGRTGFFISLCHGWSSGCTSFLTERVLGVRPTGAGYKTVEIEPDLGDLKWAKGDVPTPHGILHTAVSRQGSSTMIAVTLPPGIAATVDVVGSAASVNGKPMKLDQTGGKEFLTLRHAGTYRIVAS